MPDDIISQIMNSTFLGVPTIFIIALFIVMIIFIILFFKMRKIPGFKRKSLEKEIKKEIDELYNQFAERVGKPIRAGGFMKAGYCLGFFSLFWDKNTNLRANLQRNKEFKKYAKRHPDLFDEKGNLKPDIEEMVCLRTCKNNTMNRVLANLLNYGVVYRILPRQEYQVNEKEIVLNMFMNAQPFFGVVLYSDAAKEYVENIAYKLNRQNELDEFVNYIPKQNYLETNTASVVAQAREKAEIEKEKYRGQIESAEES